MLYNKYYLTYLLYMYTYIYIDIVPYCPLLTKASSEGFSFSRSTARAEMSFPRTLQGPSGHRSADDPDTIRAIDTNGVSLPEPDLSRSYSSLSLPVKVLGAGLGQAQGGAKVV